MVCASNRRDFLGILLSGAAGLALPARASGLALDAPGAIAASRLADNLILVSGAGANVVVAAGAERVVMINGGLPARSAELLKLVAEQTGGTRIQTLFNIDWHPDYTGSNEPLAKAGATIVAHENTKQYIGTELYVDWQKRIYKPLPQAALPTKTFYTPGSMSVGAERIDYAHLGQAHTDGAISVFFRGSNVLMTGGALSVGEYPIPNYAAGGWLGGLIAANKTLLALADAETRIVPGIGPLQTRADLQAQHDMLAATYDRFVKMMKQGMVPDDILASAPTKEFDAKWGQPDLFVSTAYRSMWLHVRELGGIV
jgi:glyoxylase-like metal-dependent hydrolase (beta-lactamase superfamily II)